MAIAAGDWRDTGAYSRFLTGDRRCFAWEWLRRTPDYVRAWAERSAPTAFGLVRLEDPALDGLTARPIWNAEIDRGVLHADGWPAEHGDGYDFARFTHLTTAFSEPYGRTHILLSDGLRSIRVDLECAGLPIAPLLLTWHIAGVSDIGARISALAQFVGLARHGRFLLSLHPREPRAHRWTQMLRVHDALGMGASAREIVAGLFGIDTSGPHWRIEASAWRLRAQRLAAGARVCLAMGPAGWLGNSAA